MIAVAGGILLALFELYLLAYAIGHSGTAQSICEPEDPLLAAQRRRFEDECHRIGRELFKDYAPVTHTWAGTDNGMIGGESEMVSKPERR